MIKALRRAAVKTAKVAVFLAVVAPSVARR